MVKHADTKLVSNNRLSSSISPQYVKKTTCWCTRTVNRGDCFIPPRKGLKSAFLMFSLVCCHKALTVLVCVCFVVIFTRFSFHLCCILLLYMCFDVILPAFCVSCCFLLMNNQPTQGLHMKMSLLAKSDTHSYHIDVCCP